VGDVLVSPFDTPGHDLRITYVWDSGSYTIICSCGEELGYHHEEAQNLGVGEVLAWIACKHTGQPLKPLWSAPWSPF
jgi:hypothetical protein